MLEPAIPYSRQWIDDDDIEAVVHVLRSDYLTTGPAVPAFEEDLQRVTGARHAVAVSSGTAALHAAYAAVGVGPGNEVITSPLTFAATANAALYLGARPVFVDIETDTGTIDTAAVEAAVTPRTRAVVAIDFAGLPADYEALRAVATRHGISLIADAAHSLGATYNGRPVGGLADVTILSFHPVKAITTGEGGAVLTDDDTVADFARTFRTHGIVRAPARLRRPDGPWHHEIQTLGFNYRLTDIQAALGSSQLRKLGRFIARRREIAAFYDRRLSQVAGIRLPGRRAGRESAWHLYVLRVDDPSRRRPFFEALRAHGLGAQLHYIPVYHHPLYEDLGYARGLCPRAEDYSAGAISIPLYPALTEEQVTRVVEVIASAAQEILT
jgi:UDP-4-amino-4,6-dideoxy-N-acetyl-beta-L-altrosamine transaminase